MSKRAIKKVRPFKVGDRVKLCLDGNGRWKDAAGGPRFVQLQGTYGNVVSFVSGPTTSSDVNTNVGIYVHLDTDAPNIHYAFMKEDLQHVVYQIDEQP